MFTFSFGDIPIEGAADNKAYDVICLMSYDYAAVRKNV